MKWHNESWRKLYRTCPPSWLRLPVLARGLGSELIKYVDDEGYFEIGTDDPGTAMAYMMGARPREHKQIRDLAAELVKDGYLVVEGTRARIRNFVQAQDRTPGAKRTAEWRARQEKSEPSPETSQPASHETSHETSREQVQVTTIDPIRSETKRDDGTAAPREAIEAELRRHPSLVHVVDRAVMGFVDNALMAGLRVEDAIEAIQAVAVDVPSNADETRIRQMLRGYLSNAKKRGDERRAKASGPAPTTLRKGIEAPDLRMKAKPPEVAS